MIIELADKTKWARMPDPPFTGEPWVGQHENENMFFATDRETLLLDALESVNEGLKDLKQSIRDLIARREGGEVASYELLYAKLEELIGE